MTALSASRVSSFKTVFHPVSMLCYRISHYAHVPVCDCAEYDICVLCVVRSRPAAVTSQHKKKAFPSFTGLLPLRLAHTIFRHSHGTQRESARVRARERVEHFLQPTSLCCHRNLWCAMEKEKRNPNHGQMRDSTASSFGCLNRLENECGTKRACVQNRVLVCARVNFMYFPSLWRRRHFVCLGARALALEKARNETEREQPRKCYTFR